MVPDVRRDDEEYWGYFEEEQRSRRCRPARKMNALSCHGRLDLLPKGSVDNPKSIGS